MSNTQKSMSIAFVVQDGVNLTPSITREDQAVLPSFTIICNLGQNLGAKLVGSPLLQELFLSVKTTERFHYPRLVIILETWGSLAKEQTWYFTDTSNSSADGELERRSGGHLVSPHFC